MSRVCGQCRTWRSEDDYSNNQWFKGNGASRCRGCVAGYRCQECHRSFNNSNELKMHMQVHRPQSVACPLCGEGRFRSGANAVQHVESGYCSGCRGQSNAREQIYRFASSQRAMQPYLSDVPRLTYNGYVNNDVPDFPYSCPDCFRSFKQLSQLLQHQDNKHGSQPLRLQYWVVGGKLVVLYWRDIPLSSTIFRGCIYKLPYRMTRACPRPWWMKLNDLVSRKI